MKNLLALAGLAIGFATACGSNEGNDVEQSQSADLARAPGHFVARLDPRKCVSPLCGGYFVSLVNRRKTQCIDGSLQPECYVARLNLSATGLPPDQQDKIQSLIGGGTSNAVVVFRGALRDARFPGFGNLGELAVSEAWVAPEPTTLSGTFYGLRNSGIVCVTYPCPSIEERTLNSRIVQNIDDVDFSNAPGNEKQQAAARAAIDDPGLLATGKNVTIPEAGPAGAATVLSVNQYFMKAGSGLGSGEPCDSHGECAAGLLCCYPCGVAPGDDVPNACHNTCMPPMGGGCPLFP